jgi:recA bacterial DNA recombination protein
MNELQYIRSILTSKPEEEMPLRDEDFVSWGDTRLNLACTGRSKCGIKKGSYVLSVGDSDTGKTMLGLTMLTEAANNPNFDDYDLHYNGPEGGAGMDFEQCFGKKADNRISRETTSTTVEHFWSWMDKLMKGPPFMVVLDSMDALDCEADIKKRAEQESAKAKGKKTSGSYGVEKARINSQRLRVIIPKLNAHGSVLDLIAQTRDAIGYTYQEKTRSGGKGMKFYADLEFWLMLKGKIYKDLGSKYGGKKIDIGARSIAKVKRSRYTGKRREAEVIIYSDVGVDNVGGSVEYLMEWRHWGKTKGRVNAPEFQFDGSPAELIRYIDSKPERKIKLRKIVTSVWKQVESLVKVVRNKEYT